MNIKCDGKWSVWCRDSEVRAFIDAFKKYYPENDDYMNRLSFDRHDEESDVEHVEAQVDTIDAVIDLLAAAKESGIDEYGINLMAGNYSDPIYMHASICRYGKQRFRGSEIRVAPGAESKVLEDRIRNAVNVLSGGEEW